jgi:hypothetical protein
MRVRTSLISILTIGLLAGSAVGVTAQDTDDPGPAAYVHGSFVGAFDCCGDEVETFDDAGNRLTLRGMVDSAMLEMDDPRISGAWEETVSIDEFPQPGTDERVEVHWGELTITNDDGSWSGTWKSTYDSSQFPQESALLLYELTGAGAYEGLSALLGRSEAMMSMGGAIFPSPLPPR